MKKNQFKLCQSLAIAALLLGSASLAFAAQSFVLNSFDTTENLNPTGGKVQFGTATLTYDATSDNTGNGGGSAYIQSTFGVAGGQFPVEVVLVGSNTQPFPGAGLFQPTIDFSQYANVQFDFKWDNTSTMTLAQFNNYSLIPTNPASGFENGGAVLSGQTGADIGNWYQFTPFATTGNANVGSILTNSMVIPVGATGGWVHITVPITPTLPNLANSGGIEIRKQLNNFSTLTNNLTAKFWIDNIFLQAITVALPPPILSITGVKPGLNFVQGSVSGNGDRQGINTVNTPNNFNYGWVGNTGSGPVTYSFNVSQWNAPDLIFHVFITPNTTDTASAPDFNQPYALVFQLSTPNGVGAPVATVLWKTNMPSFISTNFALNVTNTGPVVGTWQLQFTSDTSGSVIAPNLTSYPFGVDPGLAAGLANPVYVSFGVNPVTNTNGVGESVVVSQIAITGSAVSSLSSAATINTDNFLNDSVLDTNTWAISAIIPGSILLIPTNTAYSVNWTIPDGGYSLVEKTNLQNLTAGVNPGLTAIALTPGKRTLIPKASLPGNPGFFYLIKRTFTQLQVLMPGETNAPNTLTGKTGTPTGLSAETPANITVNAVDANWNIVNNVFDNINLTTTDSSAIGLPTTLTLINGTGTLSGGGAVLFDQGGPWTVTAQDTSTVTIPNATSASFTVGP
jgi:hypothetical protein